SWFHDGEWWDSDCHTEQDLIDSYGEDFVVNLSNLKRLVESIDLVNSLGGLKAARSEAHKDCFAYNQPLLAAIAAYESIYGG
ncbi:hypothetical protein WAI85_21700, partial [Acinetobacter baumannii]